MVGAFAVGKTSLVKRFVKGVFDERYLTTVGVKIDRKEVHLGDQQVNVMLWDLAGEDALSGVRLDYLRGASGYVLVVDGTRPDTLDTAITLRTRIQGHLGGLPSVVAVNKSDLQDEWRIEQARLDTLREAGSMVVHTSAMSGEGVEPMFQGLVQGMLGRV